MALLTGAGGVAAAALLRSEPPTRPEAGVVCRARAERDADALVLPMPPDPVDACRTSWTNGEIPGADLQLPVPALTPCIGSGGAVEVFPAIDTCDELGLASAASALTSELEAVVRLQQRIADDVNAQPCRTTQTVRGQVRRLLDELELVSWSIEVEVGFEHSMCAKAEVDAAALTVRVAGL